MFYLCSNLTRVDVSSFETLNVTNMSYMFYGCSSLVEIVFSKNFNTSNVTNMYDMFSQCNALTNLDLSGFDTSNVTNMGYMFDGCRSLTDLNLSSFDTSNVTNMYGMFYDCNNLVEIVVGGKWDTEGVRYSNYMFYGCIKLPNFNSGVIDKTNAHNGFGGYLSGMDI